MNELRLIEDLIRDEGERLKPYKDTVGKLTIGIGRNLDDRGITKAESRFLLKNDLNIVYRQLDQLMPWWKSLDDVRQRALFNMCFNVGITRLIKFKLMLRALEDGKFEKAAHEAEDSIWYTQVPNRAKRIVHMLRTGKDPV